jgi:hypothetical protein
VVATTFDIVLVVMLTWFWLHCARPALRHAGVSRNAMRLWGIIAATMVVAFAVRIVSRPFDPAPAMYRGLAWYWAVGCYVLMAVAFFFPRVFVRPRRPRPDGWRRGPTRR